LQKQKFRANANYIIVPIKRETVVQIPVVSAPLLRCAFLYAGATESNHLLLLAKAKDSRYRLFQVKA
jgi:hypothetical protein